MPFHLAIGLKAPSIDVVSEKLRQITGFSSEPHESSYLGEYDLFQMPEKVQVKYNFVVAQEGWDYPQHQEYGVLIVAEETERPDFFRSLVINLGFENMVLEEMSW
ncbi:MAG: hypothetical protein M3362_21695 [Acidobacteriota bacterium]|nr:hypothetical protein [Acidobacteriota bacterium]